MQLPLLFASCNPVPMQQSISPRGQHDHRSERQASDRDGFDLRYRLRDRARALADCGAAVVINGRSPDSVKAAQQRLVEQVPGCSVDGIAADLASARWRGGLSCGALARPTSW